MSKGVVSFASQSSFHNTKNPFLQPTNPNLEPNSHHVSFATQLPKPFCSMKFRFETSLKATSTTRPCLASERETFYDLLEIHENATLLEIKKAYKKLARKYHPDVSPPEEIIENTNKFIQVQEAYETLIDPKTRASYDRVLTNGFDHMANLSKNSYDMNEWWRKQWRSQLEELWRRSNRMNTQTA